MVGLNIESVDGKAVEADPKGGALHQKVRMVRAPWCPFGELVTRFMDGQIRVDDD